MLKENIRLSELCKKFEEELLERQYSADSLYRYRKVMSKMMAYITDDKYTPEACAAFLRYKIAEMGGFNEKGAYSKTQMYYVRTVRSLEEYYLYEEFFRRKKIPETINWPSQFKTPIESFLSELEIKGNCSQNIWRYTKTIQELLTYLNKCEINSLDNITNTHITKYITSLVGYAPKTIQAKISCLRVFLKYLYLNEYISTAIWSVLPKVQGVCRTKVPTVWSQDDIQKILNVIDIGNPVGKRDYAIILLIAKTGLRSGDVVNLKLSDIDWEKNEINIVQGKTKNSLVLPLMPDVGWAIIDYLKNGRPITESHHVFVSHLAPFAYMSYCGALYSRITKYIWKAGLPLEHKERIGMHSLRHSLASTLLQNDVEINTIADILGHKDPETTKHYLTVNLKALRQCPIIVAGGDDNELDRKI